jgi:hypothetical protein
MKQLKAALGDIGGEPLIGSGFENEKPDPDFSDAVPAAPEPLRPPAQ